MSRHFAWHLMANEFHVRSVKIPGTSFYLIASASRLICICNGGPGQLSSSGGPLEPPVQDHQPRREGGGWIAAGLSGRKFLGQAGGGFFFLSLKLCRSSYFTGRMIPRLLALLALLSITASHRTQAETNANRLTYLDETDPFTFTAVRPRSGATCRT